LAAGKGSVLLVGDAKQSIYRWRGGKPEQFMSLINNQHTLPVDACIANLPTNYRSCKEVVKFNNDFFNFCSKAVFSDATHQNLYLSATQEQNKTKPGMFSFLF
jgi:ATP-dependent exoDNAse (exonuclease V) beta subunit